MQRGRTRASGRRRRIGIAALALALAALAAFALWPRPPRPPARGSGLAGLEAYLEAITRFGRPPGLSLAVVEGGSIRYCRGFGMADAPRSRAATPDTVYHWWSMTKIPTAIAVLQLEEQRRLRLGDEVTRHLPWFEVEYPSPASPRVTIGQLLTHTSGLPDLGIDLVRRMHRDGDPQVDQTAFVREVLPAHAKLASDPGTRVRYSNLGYIVLGAVIEAVSGSSYEEHVREHVLRPLRMTRTDFVYSEALRADEAAGSHPLLHPLSPLLPFVTRHWSAFYRETRGRHIWFDRLYTDYTPSTGLIGPAPDVARLMLAYLGGGTLEGRRLLSAQSLFVMTHSEPPGSAAPARGRAQGLGWVVGLGERRYLQHDGGGPGFGTSLRLYPAEGLGVTVLTNDTTTDLDSILDLAAGIEWSAG